MNCRSAETLFSAFLDDELNQAERRHFESHLLGCRRCSQSLRELKGAMAVVFDAASESETSPHFEADLMARIRSGEAMRPSVIEWFHELLTPERLRPLFVVGVGACAVFVAVLVFNWNTPSKDAPQIANRGAGPEPAAASPVKTADPGSAASSSAAPLEAPSNATLASSSPTALARKGIRAQDGNGIVEIADRVVPSAHTNPNPALSNPDSQFVDEYVTDHFFLQRGATSDPQQSTIVPVTDKAADDVYIEF